MTNNEIFPCERSNSQVNRAFQRRWCVLRGNLLFYSANQGDRSVFNYKKQTFSFLSFREPLGVIILEGCTVELAEEETEVYAFKIQFHGDGKTMGRTYSLGTQTMEDLEQWMKLVRYVIQIVFFCSINPGGLKESSALIKRTKD